jgi:hypothetical protein
MKTIIVGLIWIACVVAFIVSSNVRANEVTRMTYEAVCMNYAQLLNVVDTFEEIPLARGLSVPLGKKDIVIPTVIFLNTETNTFTITEQIGDDKYCVIMLGTNFQPVPTKIQKEFKDRNDKRKL